MTASYIAAIDQGTTSSRCMIFDAAGAIVAVAQREHRQIYPKPGWVEHDAEEIWANVQEVVAGALAKLAIGPSDLAAVGLTATVAQKLAGAGMSCNVIAGYFHDHLFVPVDRGREAMTLLQEFSDQ